RGGARCQPAAIRSFPASALRNPDAERGRGGQGADWAAGCTLDVADGSYAGATAVSQRSQASGLLSRQGSRHDRRRTRPSVRTAFCLSEGRSNRIDRKSTRLNSSHVKISYAVFCLKKKKTKKNKDTNKVQIKSHSMFAI